MRFTLSWIEDYLAGAVSLPSLLETMGKAGLEVESVDDPRARLKDFSVAHVLSAEPHPDADKLRVCHVATADGEKQIVCGAPNARAGMAAIYAPLGTFIPGLGFALDKKPRKIRGIESHGMLCSLKELEAGSDSDGIADLPLSIAIGTEAALALGLADPVIDFEVTPNRPDWLGVRGIARDLAAAGLGSFIEPPLRKLAGGYDCPIEIRLAAPEACPVFAGVFIRGVKNGPSPAWLQARLRAIGLTPKSLLVDVTNYVSFDRARPLHAYDASLLEGSEICARLAEEGEILEALDGKTYALTPDMCVIADAGGVVGLGGVMGGQRTAVRPETSDIFLESAWFDPERTARTGRATGIFSDARYRFERGVDPNSCLEGLSLAVQLILEAGGGTPSRVQMAGAPPGHRPRVAFHKADLARLTGLDTKPARMKALIRALGCDFEDTGETWFIDPPSWRFDLAQSADIVEEIARLEGYDKLPTRSLPPIESAHPALPSVMQERVRTARRVMAARGFLEAVTWSFMDAEHAALFGGTEPGLRLANPVASHLNQMRPSILPNLAQAAQRGANRGERELRLFEAGPIYLDDGPKDQRIVIAALVRTVKTRHWQGAAPAYDAYSAKADLFAVLTAINQPPERFSIEPPQRDHWHPGQAACLKLGPKMTIAHFGALHPGVLKALNVEGPMFGFELNLNALPQMKAQASKTKPLFEAADLTPVRRDFAFVVDRKLPVSKLLRAAESADKTLIASVDVFDVYTGEGIEADKKSVAIEVTLQPREQTLNDAQIEALSQALIASVMKATGGVLRT